MESYINILDLIAKKRDQNSLNSEEIHWIISRYVSDAIPDYQMAALLMAVYLRGMNFQETAQLVHAMLHSGTVIDLSDLAGPKIDKHSTGGVGDKVSLILAPLVASVGVMVPMISGRALAHTGGTLDKLESIPGFRTDLSVSEFKALLAEIKVSMIGQTDDIVPADKKMYALRDATSTIASVPLITASILSKKLAAGITGLVLDVKTGRGAFMKEQAQAEQLAHSLVQTADLNGLPAVAYITAMDQPLGYTAGNWPEVLEVLECLQSRGPADLLEITLALAEEMVALAEPQRDRLAIRNQLEQNIRNGAAMAKFLDLVEKQGGNVEVLQHPERYPGPAIEEKVLSADSGIVTAVDALHIGRATTCLGAGRFRKEDVVDPKAGLRLLKKAGDVVQRGEPLAILYCDRRQGLLEAMAETYSAYHIGEQKQEPTSLIFKRIDSRSELSE
jgi:pyrimidine-nucleoside phosphorylase